MIEIILTCVFISMAICGLWLSTEPNMVLYPFKVRYMKVGSWISYKYHSQLIPFKVMRLLDWLQKPLFDCVTCMASIWGTIGWFVIRSIDGLQHTDFILWPIAILAIAFLNTILIRLT